MSRPVRWLLPIVGFVGAAVLIGGLPGVTSGKDPVSVYYEGTDVTDRFVLDQSGSTPKMRFEGTTEIILLEPVPGPRGDLFLKSGEGGPVLRVSPIGGATLYRKSGAPGRPFGSVGNAPPLEMTPRDRAQAKALAESLQDRLKFAHGLTVAIETDWESVPFEGIVPTTLADSIENVATALERLVKDDLARSILSDKLRRIHFVPAPEVRLRLWNNDLTVYYISEAGLVGRPASHQIAKFLEENL